MDALLVTRGTSAALSALPEVIHLYPPEAIYWAEGKGSGTTAREMLDALAEQGLNALPFPSGSSLDLGSGARIRLLTGAVLVERPGFRALLPLSAPEDLPPSLDGVNLLVLDSSAIRVAPLEIWQAALHPQATLVDGPTGPQTAGVVGVGAYRWLEVSTDGDKMGLRGERR